MTFADPARIDLGPDEGLPDLLMRVKTVRGDEITASFDAQSNLLLTASEFRQLRATADQVRVNVILETNDPLRIQLASMFGFARVARPMPTDDEPEVEHPNWPQQPDRATVARSNTPVGTVETSKPWREEAVQASTGISVPPKPIPKPEFAMEPRTGSIQKQEPTSRAKTSPVTIIGIAATVVAILCLAAVLSVILRTGTITVKTQRQSISTNLVVGYSTDGSQISGATITLPAQETDFTIPYVTTVSSTGTLDSDLGKATGAVELRNISGKAQTVPSGTELKALDGTTFVTTAEVKLAKGDAEKPASGTVTVLAASNGATSNLGAGVFTGQIESIPGVYFSNISAAFTGGSDQNITVVSDSDLTNAQTAAQAELLSMAQTWELPDGRVVVPSTVIATGDPSVAMDQAAGAQVATFNVSAQQTFRALTIDPNNLPDDLQAELRSTLEQSVPGGYRLTDEPIRFTDPVESTPGSGLLEVNAAIDAAAILDQNTIDDIEQAAARKSTSEAETAIASIPGVTVTSITVQPSLLAKRLPGVGRIKVVEQ